MGETYPTTGRSAVWVDANVLGIREVALPPLGPGEVLVRIRACGICGSDLHPFHTDRPQRRLEGIGPGHELAGEVAAIGPGVSTPAVGARVAMLAGRTCRDCLYCRSGRPQICPSLRIAGANYPGGMGEYFIAQAEYTYAIPESLSWPVAALSEPCGIALHGLKRANLRRGQDVLILGAGTIGLFATLVAHDAGAARIGVTARYPHQAEAARMLGATDVFDPNDVGRGSAAASHNWDVVVETVGGTAPTLQQACDLVARAGTVVVLGVFTAPVSLVTLPMLLKELTILPSFGYDNTGFRSDYDDTLALLARHQAKVEPLVTHTFPLEEANRAFETALDKTSGAIKVTVLP